MACLAPSTHRLLSVTFLRRGWVAASSAEGSGVLGLTGAVEWLEEHLQLFQQVVAARLHWDGGYQCRTFVCASEIYWWTYSHLIRGEMGTDFHCHLVFNGPPGNQMHLLIYPYSYGKTLCLLTSRYSAVSGLSRLLLHSFSLPCFLLYLWIALRLVIIYFYNTLKGIIGNL